MHVFDEQIKHILKIFRLIAKIHAEIPDDEVCKWIFLARPIVSKKNFRRLYETAIAYLAAHLIYMSNQLENEADGILPISSISEDGASENYFHQSVNLDTSMAALKESGFGRTFLSMRQPTMSV